jgi:hypothetical protein
MIEPVNLKREDFLPQLYEENRYLFSTIITEGKKQKTINREIEIIYIDEISPYRFLFQVMNHSTKFESNYGLPNKIMYQRIACIFDYLELIITPEGKIVVVHNIKEVYEKAIQIINKLKKDYVGYVFDQFTKQILEICSTQKLLINYLKDYKMLGLYFTGCYIEYSYNKSKIFSLNRMLQDYKHQKVEEKYVLIEEQDKIIYTFELEDKSLFKTYNGKIIAKLNQIERAKVEIETEEINIKYTMIWVG